MKSNKEPVTNRLTDLLLKVQDYAFDLKYLKGKENILSDPLSRLQIVTEEDVHDVAPLNFLHYLDTAHIYTTMNNISTQHTFIQL